MRTMLLLTAVPFVLLAAPGDLDQSFGVKGKVFTKLQESGDSDRANSIIIQEDGKIVVAGSSYRGNSPSLFALARYDRDGKLDTTFGGDGKVVTEIGTIYAEINSIALRKNGDIIAAGNDRYYHSGNEEDDIVLARYASDGTYDAAFENQTDINDSNDLAEDLVLQNNGKIIVVGSTEKENRYRYFIMRFNVDGNNDGTFGKNTMVVSEYQTDSENDTANAVALQSNGKIVIAGASMKGGNYDFALARYNPADGSLDKSFGKEKTGKVVRAISGGHDLIYDIAIQKDDKIVAAGIMQNGNNFNLAVARFLPDGRIDTQFGNYGVVTTDIGGGYDEAKSIVIQPNGKIIIAGYGEKDGSDVVVLVRYKQNGGLDSSFGEEGIVLTKITDKNAYGEDVALQADGRIVVTGYSNDSSANDRRFTTIRYQGDPPALVPVYYLLQ